MQMTSIIKPNIKTYAINTVLVLTIYGIISFSLYQGVLNNFHRGILILICINIMLATSLNLSAGFLGQLVLGHAAFMYIGAYSSAILSIQLNIETTWGLLISLGFGGCMAALIGALIGIPALRLRGDYLAIITLGFGQIIKSIAFNLSITGGPRGLGNIPRLTNFNVAFFVMLGSVVILMTLIRSRHGRAMIAIREDEIAAEAVGISTTFYKILGFSVSAFFAGIAGGLFAHHIAFLMPQNIGFEYSIELLVIVVLGGMGSITGSILAAVILTVLPELLREFSDYRMLVYSILLIVTMIFRPKGLMGTYEFSIQKIIRKLTDMKQGVGK